MNDCKRVSTIINGNRTDFFDMILLNINDKNVNLTEQGFGNTNTTSFNINDPSVYIYNPIQSNIKTFQFELYDKNNNLLKIGSEILRFSITLCIYDYKRKVSQY